MHVISRKRLVKFGKETGQEDAVAPLDAWYRIAKAAKWQTPQDVKDQFGNTSFLAKDLVVFNIAGNKYRLVTHMRYKRKRVYLLHVFTHKQYDEWSASRH